MNQVEFIHQAMKGNIAAEDFCRKLFNISQIMDDLIDQDNPITNEDIFKCFWDCLIELPKNPFYIQHQATLIPMMQVFLTDYRDSVILERGDYQTSDQNRQAKHIAFIIRNSLGSILIHCAYLVGGYEHMTDISNQVRLMIFNESFEEYQEALCAETQARTSKTPS